jgi:hypothetical protein
LNKKVQERKVLSKRSKNQKFAKLTHSQNQESKMEPKANRFFIILVRVQNLRMDTSQQTYPHQFTKIQKKEQSYKLGLTQTTQ